MSIDINDLPLWAQKQVASKLANQMRGKTEQPSAATKKVQSTKTERKYHNTPTERVAPDGTIIKFDGIKEAKRFDELWLLYQAGKIVELKLQPQFTLQESYITPEGVRVRAIRYVADFSYNTGAGMVVEDVKSKATKTRTYKLKRKLMIERFGINITEVE